MTMRRLRNVLSLHKAKPG